MYGVSYSLTNMIRSAVNLHFADVVDNRSIPMSRVNPDFGKIELADKKKAEYELETIINTNYENYWNDNVVKTTDTGINKTKYFLVGGMLKTFSILKNLNLSGKITKYTTSENIEKLGIEIDNSLKEGSNNQTVYDELNNEYNESLSANYPIIYKGNSKNVDMFITDFLYNYIIVRIKNAIESNDLDFIKDRISDILQGVGTPLFYNSAERANSFVIQMPLSDKNIYISITLKESLRTLLNDLKYTDSADFADSDFRNEKYEFLNDISKEDLMQNLIVRFNFTDNADIEAIYYLLKNFVLNSNEPNLINEPVLIYTKDTKGIANKMQSNNPNLTIQESWSSTATVNSTNFGTRAFLSSRSVFDNLKSALEIDYIDFINFVEYAQSEKKEPSFVTSSVVFNNYSSSFVLDTFKNEVVTAKVDDYDNTYFDRDIEGGTEDILDAMIEDLYNTIIK